MGFLPLPRHCTSSRRHPGRKHGRAETAAPTSQTIIERLVSFVFARLLCFLPLRRINTPASAADREDDGEDGGRAPPWRLFPNTHKLSHFQTWENCCVCVSSSQRLNGRVSTATSPSSLHLPEREREDEDEEERETKTKKSKTEKEKS